MKVLTPFNHLVPKDPAANLRWRIAVHKRVMEDPAFAAFIKQACATDPLFVINGFGWTYDPRNTAAPKLPFILYPFQENAILELLSAVGDHDLLIEKSRDMGASWLCIAAATWCWLFCPAQSILFVSRVEEYVDKPGNPKAMFWKFDYLVDNLPIWLQPEGYDKSIHRSKLHVENPENSSVIDGESTTGNVARGDRRTVIILDEFAAVEQGHRVLNSTQRATNCRIFNSTPNGINNAFYDVRQTNIKKLRMHWSLHPIYAAGLYNTDGNGKLKVLDDRYPPGYEPILDGRLRSPWYDGECERAVSMQSIAQELDIDYLGSGFQFFNDAAVQEVIRKYSRPPVIVGDLEYDDVTGEPIRFREDAKGSLRLWCLLNRDNEPPKEHKVILGCDVSAGTGASNSCGEAWDAATCEKIAEYVNPYMRPEQFAKQMVALARWLGNAYVIWENNGPGKQFGSRVVELGYGNIFMRQREEAISKDVSDVPGWASSKEGKLVLMGNYRSAIEKGEAVNRSKEALEETLEYIYANNGGIVHARATSKTDPSGAQSNHGDRAMADALAWKCITERSRRLPGEKPPEIPVGSLAWRNKMREQAKQTGSRELDSTWR